MNSNRKILLLIALISISGFAQEVKKFTYAGNNGLGQNGSVKVNYVLFVGDRIKKLETLDSVIDLNEYKGVVHFGISLSDLKVGLNNKRTKLRHSKHYKNFYLKIYNLSKNVQGLGAVPPDTLRIASKDDHLGKLADVLHYRIDTISSQRDIKFIIRANTISKEYNIEWLAMNLIKTIKVAPRTPKASKLNQNTSVTTAKSSSLNKPKRRRSYTSKNGKVKAHIEEDELSIEDDEDTLESRIWADIEAEVQTVEKRNLLKKCRIYRDNCYEGFLKSCDHLEDVLFYMAKLVTEEEQLTIAANYFELFPDGIYKEQLQALTAIPKPEKIPIKTGLAKIDADANAVVVNRVKGGKKPYYIGFYNEDKSKEYAIKGLRFNKEQIAIHLDSLNITEGTYVVRVTDADNQIFAQQDALYIHKTLSLPNSIKLTAFLILMGLIGFLYKKYIHF